MKAENDDSFQTDSEDENAPVFELMPKETLIRINKDKTSRNSITAEAYGHYNKESIFHHNKVKKTES